VLSIIYRISILLSDWPFFQNTIENQWLGFNKVLLFGKPVEKERTASLDKKMAGLTKYFDLICFPIQIYFS